MADTEAKKDLTGAWASAEAADRTDPEDQGIDRREGFGVSYEQVGSGSAPERAVFNQKFREWDGLAIQGLRNGLPLSWDADVDYVLNAFVKGEDGRIYVADEVTGPATGNPTDPLTDGQTVWRVY